MHPNEELLRRGYEAFGRGDMDTISEIFADDIVCRVPGRSALAGEYKGKQTVFEFFGRLFQATNGTFATEIVDVCAGDERVFCLTHDTMEVNGQRIEDQQCDVYEVRNGKVTRATFYSWDQYRFDEAMSGVDLEGVITQETPTKIET